MSHSLWVNPQIFIFVNFLKKIEDYIEDDNTNYVIWTNKPGLQGFADVIAKHARKCDKNITPCFNGFKVYIQYE